MLGHIKAAQHILKDASVSVVTPSSCASFNQGTRLHVKALDGSNTFVDELPGEEHHVLEAS